ncbi:alpha/beta hydrolase [Virgibacillus sp. MSP4-1]|uniref:alpha/beta hydrolase n=1 Tax=Virgibacillus sp. MSP4-1 TaxID=2700081 RepID=UPI00039BABC6|nr:alpha/beta fold hydrolase [Virgibacillus sp. MSP4-1]
MKRQMLIGFVLIITSFFITGCKDQTEEGSNERKQEKKLEGTWDGEIQIPDRPLPIVITFSNEDDWMGTISIPVQGVKDYPLSNISIDLPQVFFQMERQGQKITFDGEKKGESIEGTFSQNGQSFPFTIEMREDRKEESEEDEGPFMSVDTPNGELNGELLLPDGAEGPYPVVLMIPGSGPTDRNGNTPTIPGKNNSLKMLAEGLAENGIASLRYDKRGVGKNQNALIAEEDLRFDDFVTDAQAWIQKLNRDAQFSNVGVIGHSQGSLVGMLAAADTDVDTFISIAGASRSIDEVLYDQLQAGLSDDLMKESKKILEQLKQGEKVEDIPQALQSTFRPSVQAFMSSWMKYNPVEEIQKLSMPVLVINGEHDVQVTKKEAENLHEAHENFELLIINEMNHVLKRAPEERAENLDTYSNPDLPLAEGLMDGILSFLQNHQFVK